MSYAVGEALFAEASVRNARLRQVVARSARILVALQIPGVVIVAFGAAPLLDLFGGQYAMIGTDDLLVVFAFGALTVAFNTFCSFILRVTRQIVALMLSNLVFAVLTIGLAWRWIPSGLPSLGWAWLLGNLASGLVAAAALVRSRARGGRAAAAGAAR